MSWVFETTAAEARARTVLLKAAASFARGGDGARATAVRDAVDTLTAERNRLLAGWWGDNGPTAESLLAYADRLEEQARRYRAAAAELDGHELGAVQDGRH